jgi:NADH-quinone oxidoreductase subunit A
VVALKPARSLPVPLLMTTALWPLVLYSVLVIVLVAALVAVSYVLGERGGTRATDEPFEAGIVSVGDARLRLSAKYYLVAMFFVIFDVEALFIYAWAVALREAGWPGFVEAAIFIGILVAALVYLWRLGALDWGPTRRTRKPQAVPSGRSTRALEPQ